MNEFLFPKPDKEMERRRALAKVYSLLLRLAEEAERKEKALDKPSAEEKTQEASLNA